jgi:plastocyanin
MNRFWAILFVLAFILGLCGCVEQSDTSAGSVMGGFGISKKSPHWASNTPNHGGTLAGVPINVVIDFDFDLGDGSAISIIKDGNDYGVGDTGIDPNKLAMRREMSPDSPDGVYNVTYRACWPDGSCHDGDFRFGVDRNLSRDYEDMRGQREVTVVVKDIAFQPQNLIISNGTTVTWINQDPVIHYVNTDGHPAHTYYRAMNSRALNQGSTFSLTFNRSGIYPYHCSAHTNMTASLLIE